MSERKIWNGSQWVQIGGTVDDVLPITQSNYDALSSKDPSTMYVITDSTGAALAAQSFRVNQRLIQKIMIGSNQLWQPVIFATGGTVTDINVSGVMWRVHVFVSTGQFEVLQSSITTEYLVVAGGGKGGYGASGVNGWGGGGGGAGGMLTGSTNITQGIHTVTIGAGSTTLGAQGGSSSIGSIVTTTGGGWGGYGGTPTSGGAGGSGGGAARSTTSGIGTSGQGNNGASGSAYGGGQTTGAGGGGKGSSSGAPTNGLVSTITGSSVMYASGGSGGPYTSISNGTDGAVNTGNGGNGGSATTTGGNGGSGIVIIRYQIA